MQKKKRSSIFEGIIEADTIQQNEFLFYSLAPVQNATEYSINLATTKYFIKPYITSKFRNYFEQKGLMTIDDFVNGIQVWTAKGVKQQFREYEKIKSSRQRHYSPSLSQVGSSSGALIF